MALRVALIAYSIPRGSFAKANASDERQTEYFVLGKKAIDPTHHIYSLSELENRHKLTPYDAVCVMLPFLPEGAEPGLPAEHSELLSVATGFAAQHHLPVYFKLPPKDSPMQLSRQLQKQQASMAKLQNDAMAYEVISHSFFWRITKPFRLLSDLCKRIVKRTPGVRKLAKGLSYCKRHGIRATWRKMRHRQEEAAFAEKELYTAEELAAQREHRFAKDIKISILVPLYNTPIVFLREMIASVTAQTYSNWELCLADGSDAEHGEVQQVAEAYAAVDNRILYRKLEKNLGISENTNACIDMASGEYIALFDHDDLLHPAALFNVMEAICNQGADFVYTDELTFISPDLKKVASVHFKPDYAPDSLRGINYICHLSVFSRALLEKVGRFRKEFDGSQDHDLILRLTEQAKCVVHIPKVLYYWRAHAQSVAMSTGAKTYAVEAGKRAVLESMQRAGYNGTVESAPVLATLYRVRYDIVTDATVSIIIPNKNHEKDLRLCISSILERTTYPNYEIVIVDNGSDEQSVFDYYEELKAEPRVKLCSLDIPFNYSKLNNFAARQASGEYYLLLNNDIEILTPEWIEEMLMYVQREDVGAAGAMLYYPDDTIQHAGCILGIGGIAGHSHKRFPRSDAGYMGRLCYAQNVSAVTAACMLIKASVWQEVGGLDESFQVAFNDIDLCMKIREAGYLIVWTPHAEAYHYESKTRGLEDSAEKIKRFQSEIRRFELKWGEQLAAGDPYYNPNLTLEHENFSIAE